MIKQLAVSLVRYPHRWLGAVLLGSVAYVTLTDVRPAIHSWGGAPAQIADLREAVERVPGQIVAQVLPVVDKHAGLIRRDLFGEVAKVRVAVLDPETGQFTALRKDLADIINDRTKEVSPLLAEARGGIVDLRADLRPTLRSANALIGDAKDSWDALYPDIAGSVASSTVAITGFARASETFSLEFPKFSTSLNGIMADGHAWTDKYVRPRPLTFGGKVKAGARIALGLGGAYLRGGGL